jgi:hypothetical protein
MGTETMASVRGKPVASYETTDEYGSHHVEIDHGTRRANRYIIEQWRDTQDVLLREAFRYIHGHRSYLPPEVANAVLVDTPLYAACITELAVEYIEGDHEQRDTLDHAEQNALQYAERIVFVHEDDI